MHETQILRLRMEDSFRSISQHDLTSARRIIPDDVIIMNFLLSGIIK